MNIPEVKLGIVAVSRDCFPVELSENRRDSVIEACQSQNIPITKIRTVIENELDVQKALDEMNSQSVNALVIYLGNFGPEGPLSMLAQQFKGPVMLCGASEESVDILMKDRGDAYCGMLSACYNLGLRKTKVHIPSYPVGFASEIANMIKEYLPVAAIWIGLKNLKILTFGPRPQDFTTCHAPIQPLYDLGIEIMENSELDLYDLFRQAENDPAIEAVAKEMSLELGEGNQYPDLLKKLAQYEVALYNYYKEERGMQQFAVFANKCWPAFEKYFGFVPCYVNSRFANKGIPIACEVDVYGALSEYIMTLATSFPSTILDINNTVPHDLLQNYSIEPYKSQDLFMGFHCGNTASSCLINYSMKYQLIMHRLMEPEKSPDITRGTIEGRIRPGEITLFKLHSSPDSQLLSYIAQGEVLDIDPHTFGSIGIFAIKEMGRFYRYVLLQKKFPHHTAVGFKHAGKTIFNALKLLGIEDIYYNLPADRLYPEENPF